MSGLDTIVQLDSTRPVGPVKTKTLLVTTYACNESTNVKIQRQ